MIIQPLGEDEITTLVMLRALKGMTMVLPNSVTICPGSSNSKSYTSLVVHAENVVTQSATQNVAEMIARKRVFIYCRFLKVG